MNLNRPQLVTGKLTAADLVTESEAYPQDEFPQLLAVAVAANLDRPAMSGADPLTECLAEQCICFARPAVAGPEIIPVGFTARWWLAFKRWF